MGYCKPLTRKIARGQRYGANPGWGPNPPGGHNGDDYLSQVGEPIHAAGDGEVIFAGQFDATYADNFGWNLHYGGNMVVLNLDGPDGPYVEYGHMDKIHVKVGQRVKAAQVIGTTGATDGNSGVITGPHLHVGVLPPNFDLGTSTYGRVNPDIYLTEYPEDIIARQFGGLTSQSTQELIMAWDAKIQEYRADGKTKGGIKTAGFILGNLNQWVGRILALGQKNLAETKALRADVASLRKALGK